MFPPEYYNFIDIFSKAELDKLSLLVKRYWYNINFKNAAKTNPKIFGFSFLYKLIFKKNKKGEILYSRKFG